MARRAGYATAVSILIWLTVPAVPAAAGGGCHLGVTQGSGTTVEMVDACFTPTVLYVDPTAKFVTFVNRSGMSHNVTANQWGHFDDIPDGDGFRASFPQPGVYPFACSIHPGMSGAIVVGDGTGAGSGETVTVEPLVVPVTSPAPEISEPASGTALAVTPEPPSSAIGWLGGGALGLAAGAAIALSARRRSDAGRRQAET